MKYLISKTVEVTEAEYIKALKETTGIDNSPLPYQVGQIVRLSDGKVGIISDIYGNTKSWTAGIKYFSKDFRSDNIIVNNVTIYFDDELEQEGTVISEVIEG